MSFWNKIKSSFSKSSEKINDGFKSVFKSKKIDEDVLESLEDHLISCDLGASISTGFVDVLRKEKILKTTEDIEVEVKNRLGKYIKEILDNPKKETQISNVPHVIMLVGVNGTGKTTTAAKLALHYKSMGKKVCFGACDTFRAAAVEQLESWAKKSEIPIYKGPKNADPSSVAYDAYVYARENYFDILILDTAGRLQNKNTLMDELSKMNRVLKKHGENIPHQCLLTLDATTGQNAMTQADLFNKAIPIDGFILNKLDGSAKGGILINIVKTHNIPALWIGIGEKKEDLRPFESEVYINNLLGIGA